MVKSSSRRDLPAGHALRLEDIAVKSPGDGIPPYELDRLPGRVTRREFKEDEGFTFDDLEGAR